MAMLNLHHEAFRSKLERKILAILRIFIRDSGDHMKEHVSETTHYAAITNELTESFLIKKLYCLFEV